MVADALRVLPGQPHAWAVTLCGVGYFPCGQGLAVFDDAVQRPTRVWQNQVQPDALLFIGSDATTLYGTTMQQSPATFYKFSINSSGATETQAVTNFSSTSPGGGILDTDGTSIYVSNGQVINPADLTITSTIPTNTFDSGMRVDAGGGRVYFAGPITNPTILNETFAINAFALENQQLAGYVPMNEGLSWPEDVFRWGNNGLGVNAQNTLLLLHTSLTGYVPPQISVSGTTASMVNAGQSASYNLNVAPLGGFTGQVTFSCANLPQYASCTINPPNANLSSAAVSVTVTISTSQVQTAALQATDRTSLAGLPLLCGVTWLLVCAGVRGRSRKIGLSIALLAVFFVIAPLTGCGGGSGGSTQPPPTTLYTPAGTYSVNFESAGSGVSKTTTLTLVVQ
jgi:hypothetical protein